MVEGAANLARRPQRLQLLQDQHGEESGSTLRTGVLSEFLDVLHCCNATPRAANVGKNSSFGSGSCTAAHRLRRFGDRKLLMRVQPLYSFPSILHHTSQDLPRRAVMVTSVPASSWTDSILELLLVHAMRH